ncbi:PREDICTED: protein EMBRYO DEFECTIVE 1674 [Theobroma cacao]|uniref:Protein EMBRYO DEFECTIVE 1674 n=1 Tax=Theobroma cacao TaxID=3641 RepID=A0AB32V2W1_THECC|nr:PREDICTED: protein EMBRYO DEFECTIVE 1674 [Theobroma cacao]
MGRRRGTRYSPKPYKSDHPVTAATPLANLSLNFVLLHDWWLGRAQPRGLAIGGFECRGRQGQRVFCSAVIAKRHDATTLETADGITVAISGFINTSRTHQNGFPLEFCSHFLYGFPYDWEEYASQYSNEESAGRGTQASMTSRSNAVSFLPASLDNLPATRIRDLLMFSAGDSENSFLKRTITDHVLGKLSTHASQDARTSVDSDMGNTHSNTCSYSADGENSNCHKKVKVNRNHMDDNNISDTRSTITVESQNDVQSKMGVSILTRPTGVTTRSMTRLKYLTQKQEGLSSKSSVKHIKAV